MCGIAISLVITILPVQKVFHQWKCNVIKKSLLRCLVVKNILECVLRLQIKICAKVTSQVKSCTGTTIFVPIPTLCLQHCPHPHCPQTLVPIPAPSTQVLSPHHPAIFRQICDLANCSDRTYLTSRKCKK